MLLAFGGIGIFGVAPTLTKDRKLFADIEAKAENTEKENKDSSNSEQLNF
jgi:formate-dependent phosphoribosylglycinamide formyltransferase (GAR transformylase)